MKAEADRLDEDQRAYLDEIGVRIKAWRVRRRINQGQLADLAEVSRVTLGSIERGEHSAALLTYRKLARALQIDIGDLLREDES